LLAISFQSALAWNRRISAEMRTRAIVWVKSIV
jgi:hypothetical protein